MFKKWVSIGLSVAMLFTVSGTALAEASKAPKDAPVITIYQNSGAGNSTAGSEAGSTDAGYNMVQQYLYDQTGVWVEAQLAPKENAKEKLNVMLAGGEKIDLWWGDWRDYAGTGMIQPWNDFLEEYPLIYETWAKWDAWSAVTDADGNIWGMPRMTPTTPYQLFFRADWLDELDMEVPSTMEEVNAYLYAVKELDPYGNGQTVPLATSKYTDLEYAFVGGYVKTGNGMWLDETDGLVKPVYLADGYLDFLGQMAQWYKDGIIHKESFSWDTATIRDQIAKGAAAATATWYSNITTRDAILTENLLANTDFSLEKYDRAFVINENGIKGPNGNFIETRSNANPNALLLSSVCKNPEAALKYINWQYEAWENYYTTCFGLKDYHWQYNPDDPDAQTVTYATTGWTDENGAPMYMTVDGELSYDNTIAYYSNFTTSIGLPTEVLGTSYDQWGRQNMHNLWLQSHLDDFDVTNEPGIEYGIVWDTVALEENVPSYNDIKTYVSEQMPKFFIGERPLEDWDAFIAELEGIGLHQLMEEYTRQYELLR